MTTGPDLSQIYQSFIVSTQQLQTVIQLFLHDMREGLAHRPSSLAMLPSYLTKPTGQENGIFLALDFGGTNVRALRVKLHGNGQYTVLERQDAPLAAPAGSYDYTASSATAAELFDFLAARLAALTTTGQHYLLGHAFSFPCLLKSIDDARLLYWTKEISTSGVVGENIVALLNGAFSRQNITHIKAAAIVNDSVSALMAAAYADTFTDIGSICGTGHNTCYLEPAFALAAGFCPMYVNMESGNFNKVPGNVFDDRLDKNSDRPGAGRLEKMCSGRYVGELLRLVLQELVQDKKILATQQPVSLPPNAITGKDMALVLSDDSQNFEQIQDWLLRYGLTQSSYADRAEIQKLAGLIIGRSARLVAATYAATLFHIDPELSHQHVIAIDGSLYEKMPGYAGTINKTLKELLGEKARQIDCRLSKDGSGAGAAIAAATTMKIHSVRNDG